MVLIHVGIARPMACHLAAAKEKLSSLVYRIIDVYVMCPLHVNLQLVDLYRKTTEFRPTNGVL